MNESGRLIQAQESNGENISIVEMPKPLWLGVLLFAVNIVVGSGLMAAPELDTDLFGREVRSVHAAALKPSPFTERADIGKTEVKSAAKLRPIVYDQVVTMEPPILDAAYFVDSRMRIEQAAYEPRFEVSHGQTDSERNPL
jgi:hypothetical protein